MAAPGVMEQSMESMHAHGRSIERARRVVLGAVENGQFSPVDRDAVRFAMDQLSLTYRPLPGQWDVVAGSRDLARGILRTGSVTGWIARKAGYAVDGEEKLAAAGLLSLPEIDALALASGD